MEEGEQNRSEQPTPFKLTRARRKGTVARGMDLGFLTGLTSFLVFALIMGPQLGQTLAKAMHDALAGSSGLADSRYAVLPVVSFLFSSVAGAIAFMSVSILAVVLLFELLQTGFVFSSQPLKPDFSRLNPAKGLKRLFTFRLLIETLKNVLKFAVYSAVAYFVIRGTVHGEIAVVRDSETLAVLLSRTAVRLLGAFVLVAFMFAVIDQLIVRRDFFKKMRMSRRELRLEHREREGEPRQKQKRKQMHGEFVKAAKSLRNLRKSNVVITNPDHLAIGLQYDPQRMSAPAVVSAGAGHLAQRLKRLAFVYGIPTIEDRPLAHALYRRAALDAAIPEYCFKPVANIYNTLRKRRSLEPVLLAPFEQARPVGAADV